MKTILSFLSRAAHLSPRSGIYPGAPRPFIARSAFILLIALAMAACTEEAADAPTTSSGEAIGFGTFMDRTPDGATGIKPLASVLTTDGLKAPDAGFTVLAYYTAAADWNGYTKPDAPNFMNNQTVTWDNNRWVYDPIKYWPGTVDGTNLGKVSFFGYSTVNDASAYGEADSNPKIAYTVAATAAAQHDLVADAALDATSADGKVQFQFDHILSKIGFAAKLADTYSPATVTVNSLKVYYDTDKVHNSGTYTFNNSNTDAGNWALGATYFDEADPGAGDQLYDGGASPATLTTTASTLTGADKFLMHIPQTVADGDLYVELGWSLKQPSPDLTIPYTTPIDLPAITWAPGKAYTYNFTLALNTVEFDTQIGVNDWGATLVIPQCNDGTFGTAPGATVTFDAFNPCPEEPVGTVWYLTDTRDGGNDNTYKVKKMQDSRIWMVQDLKFGDCTDDLTYWKNDQSESDTETKPTVYDGYVGHCRSTTYTDAGFLYNWPAAMQSTKAYNGSTVTVGCSGTVTAANTCQGICPAGWHIPTGNTDGEFNDLHSNYGRDCATKKQDCWNASSDWEGVLGGRCDNSGTPYNQGSQGRYWSSTYYSDDHPYSLYILSDRVHPGTYSVFYKNIGISVRCVRNYE